ncbi:unnamed protein product, partial [Phaeothamnion confervicola]
MLCPICWQVFEGHAHYVMMVKFNTKDSNTFASASLDRSVKVWGLGAPTPHFSLDGHDRGVNCVDYYPGGDRPYLLSGADDKLVKIWDYQTKSCVQTLDGHANNVSAVLFHPRLPVILSGSEDGTVRIWHATTYRAETTLNYGMERVWALAAGNDSKKVAIGFDEGTIVLKLGHEMPVASLDTHTGKVVWAQNAEIQTATLKGLAAECEAGDGERLPVVPKEGRLNYYVGGEVMTLCHLDHPMYMLGYLPKEDRVFLVDKQQNIFSYRVRQAMLQYQTAVVRKDFEAANALLPSIPKSEYTNVARFLESQASRKGGGLTVSDLGGLLLLHASTGDRDGMAALAARARELGRTNVAFTALLLLGHVEECVALLVDTGRVPEAAFMARTYLPSDVSRLVALWKKDLATVSQK